VHSTPEVRAAAPRARETGWVLTAQRDTAEQRIRFSRNAMLVAAFAPEAYINEFIAEHFAGKDYEAVEKLSTVDKYVLAPRTALGRDLFPRDREPAQTLRILVRQRDVLVHPKPDKGLPGTVRAEGYPRVFRSADLQSQRFGDNGTRRRSRVRPDRPRRKPWERVRRPRLRHHPRTCRARPLRANGDRGAAGTGRSTSAGAAHPGPTAGARRSRGELLSTALALCG
jgi:hypothetical protein